MTKVYFSEIPQEEIQGDELFRDAEGTNYYYKVDDSPYCTDEFVLADSTGRFVPFPYEDLDALIEALENFRVNLVETVVENLFKEPDSVAILD